ncbi:MAG: SDR family NAD(P)-dependent oxidoreductase [Candidatus Kapaibacterium sp.]
MQILFFPFLYYNQTNFRRHLGKKTVLITGASYGIGEAVALRLAQTDAQLILVARTEEKLNEVKFKVEAVGGHAEVFPCDLTDTEQVQILLERLNALPNGIDVVVSNAGKSIRRSLFDSLDRFHDCTRTMNLNYFGPVQLLLSLVPELIENSGQIINVSAVNVLLAPAPKWAAYQASKTAFDQWLRSVGLELNARGVATTTIYLPLVRTRMIEPTEKYQNMPAMYPDQVAQLICRAIISRRRWYAPWWLLPAQAASVLFRWPWEAAITARLRRKRSV